MRLPFRAPKLDPSSQVSVVMQHCPSTSIGMSPPIYSQLPAGSKPGKLAKTEQTNEPITCHGCKSRILEKYLLKALDKYWHEDCLKCEACSCRLGEVASRLFEKKGMLLCQRDYLRLYGAKGSCAGCQREIPAFEMVMRAKNNVYHLNCFVCHECGNAFCVGDPYYLIDNKILCQYDYAERTVFANAQNFPGFASHIKKQFQQAHDELDTVG